MPILLTTTTLDVSEQTRRRRMHAVISSIETNIGCDVGLDFEFDPQTWGVPAARHETNSGAQERVDEWSFSRRKAHTSQPRQQQVALSRFAYKQRLVPFWAGQPMHVFRNILGMLPGTWLFLDQ